MYKCFEWGSKFCYDDMQTCKVVKTPESLESTPPKITCLKTELPNSFMIHPLIRLHYEGEHAYRQGFDEAATSFLW